MYSSAQVQGFKGGDPHFILLNLVGTVQHLMKYKRDVKREECKADVGEEEKEKEQMTTKA